MSSRIIRGDNRLQTLKLSSSGSISSIPEDHIMDVEKQAFELGYSEGERIGKQMGEAMIETICRRYEKGLAELAASRKQMSAQMEEHTVRMALEIARKIVQRELVMDPDLVTALATVALKRVQGHQSLTLRVSRQDFERVHAAIANVNPALTVKEDANLERGDFIVDTGQTHLDGSVKTQVRAIGRVLFDE